jgi:hypothetical protein
VRQGIPRRLRRLPLSPCILKAGGFAAANRAKLLSCAGLVTGRRPGLARRQPGCIPRRPADSTAGRRPRHPGACGLVASERRQGRLGLFLLTGGSPGRPTVSCSSLWLGCWRWRDTGGWGGGLEGRARVAELPAVERVSSFSCRKTAQVWLAGRQRQAHRAALRRDPDGQAKLRWRRPRIRWVCRSCCLARS